MFISIKSDLEIICLTFGLEDSYFPYPYHYLSISTPSM
jgi:hypothetical protein